MTDDKHIPTGEWAPVRMMEVLVAHVGVLVPSWKPTTVVFVPRSDIPFEVFEGERLNARVNLKATKTEDLRFTDWGGLAP